MKLTYKRVLIVGPVPPPINGNSVMTKRVYDLLSKKYRLQLINSSIDNASASAVTKALTYARLYLQCYKIFMGGVIYISMGMTFWGTIRDMIFILLGRVFGKKVVIHLHGNMTHAVYVGLRGTRRWIYSLPYLMGHKGIVLSKSLRRNLTPFFLEKDIIELPNYVDAGLSPDSFEQKLNRPFGLRILYLGIIVEGKGVLDLLDALRILHRNGVPYEAVLVGSNDPGLSGAILNIEEILPPNCEYRGQLVGEAKNELLNWSNVFVLPSLLTEGQPVALLESLVSGSVILATRQGGIPDVMQEEENGYFVEMQDPESIADRMQYLLKNEQKFKEMQRKNFALRSSYTEERFRSDLYSIFEAF